MERRLLDDSKVTIAAVNITGYSQAATLTTVKRKEYPHAERLSLNARLTPTTRP